MYSRRPKNFVNYAIEILNKKEFCLEKFQNEFTKKERKNLSFLLFMH